jgi:hypothetical protein
MAERVAKVIYESAASWLVRCDRHWCENTVWVEKPAGELEPRPPEPQLCTLHREDRAPLPR